MQDDFCVGDDGLGEGRAMIQDDLCVGDDGLGGGQRCRTIFVLAMTVWGTEIRTYEINCG